MKKLTLEQRVHRLETEVGLEEVVRVGSIYDNVTILMSWMRGSNTPSAIKIKKWYQFWK